MRAEFDSPSGDALIFECPGCRYFHQVALNHPNQRGARWQFDGDLSFPTITPSIVTNPDAIDGPRCHATVTKGKIHFYPDSQHELAGQTVDLPEITQLPVVR